MIPMRVRRALIGLVAVGSLVAALLMAGGTAAAANLGYGGDAVYQIELSANSNGPSSFLPNGFWLWIELDSNGTGTYHGSDCVHSPSMPLIGTSVDSGTVTWSTAGGMLTITGLSLADGAFHPTLMVPAAMGHYVMNGIALGLPVPDMTQLQVAP